MIKIAIVENEKAEAERLETHVRQYAKERGEECQVAVFDNGMNFLDDRDPVLDVVFMDIDMPLMDGMTTAEKMRETDEVTTIIFVTNLAQFAIKGYSVNALDYLLKPVNYAELSYDLDKVLRQKRSRMNEYMWISIGGSIRRIPYMDILYIEIMSHDIYIHTKNEVISQRGTLKDIEVMLDKKQFCRCHSGYIVNLHYVSKVDDDGTITIEGCDKLLSASRGRRKQFAAQLAEYIAANGGITKNSGGGI